jgi:hypothetical protein
LIRSFRPLIKLIRITKEALQSYFLLTFFINTAYFSPFKGSRQPNLHLALFSFAVATFAYDFNCLPDLPILFALPVCPEALPVRSLCPVGSLLSIRALIKTLLVRQSSLAVNLR